MADQLKQQNSSRLNEGGHELQTKAEQKSITNIYYDCLERIFDFLDLQSLLNVAGTCKRLQIAAAAKFGDDHDGKTITLLPFGDTEGGRAPGIYENSNEFFGQIEVIGLKFCFPFLRCFGAKIRTLEEDYNGSEANEQNDRLDHHINQYCADTLSTIRFIEKPTFSTKIFPKPFRNITKVDVWCGHLKNHLPNFLFWFPNMRSLDLVAVNTIDESAIAVSFPHLERMYILFHSAENAFSIENATNLLRVNPQLKSLGIDPIAEKNWDKLMNMIRGNPSISKLLVQGEMTDVNVDSLNRFVNEHPNINKLDICNQTFSADEAITFIRQLNSLERFHFKVKNRSECNRLLAELDEKWEHTISELFGEIYIHLNC